MNEKSDIQKLPITENRGVPLAQLSEKLIEKIGFWAPPVPAWQPVKQKNSTLCMACVVEERLYQGLRFEGDVLLLTPGNWNQVLTHMKPDFLLMESVLISCCGHWHMGQWNRSPDRETLLEIVHYARKQSIPTVFWMTRGHEYHDLYRAFSSHFDHVFCADPIEAEKLRAQGVQAELLLPCVQPALWNPFRQYEHYHTFGLNILFDGWADLDRLQDNLKVLDEIKKFGLSIIESRYRIFQNRMRNIPEYLESLLGCTTRQGRLSALKYAKVYLSFQHTLSTLTEQQWMTLEAGACRLALVHAGEFQGEDLRRDFVIECRDPLESLVELTRFKNDDLYRERIAHKTWRAVHQNHTFAQRLKHICEKMGIVTSGDEFPKVSVITPTYRPEKLKTCLERFEQQTYPNRELILVFNGNELPLLKQAGLDRLPENVKLLHIPGDLFAGACLNRGHLESAGTYCFRFDDDDYYGPNYISDMMLNTKSIDVELFGKPPAPLYFEEDQTIYLRPLSLSFCVVPYKQLAKSDIWIGGNSIAGRHRFFQKTPYDDLSYGTADSSLVYNLPPRGKGFFTLMDGLNLVAERRVDQTTHTWKMEISKGKDHGRLCDIGELMV